MEWATIKLYSRIIRSGVAGAFFKSPDTVMAELQYHSRSNKRYANYEVEIYSNEIPDPTYLLFNRSPLGNHDAFWKRKIKLKGHYYSYLLF